MNNAGHRQPPLRAVLASLGVSCEVVHVSALDESFDPSPYECVFLGGTQVSPHEHPEIYRHELSLIRKTPRPLLGVCGGHLLLALAFGGTVGTARALYGRVAVRALPGRGAVQRLVADLHGLHEDRFQVCQVPEELSVIAQSSLHGMVYAMKHRHRPLYGVQFHPERREDTYPLLGKFIELSRG